MIGRAFYWLKKIVNLLWASKGKNMEFASYFLDFENIAFVPLVNNFCKIALVNFLYSGHI